MVESERALHEAAVATGDFELGHVVGGDGYRLGYRRYRPAGPCLGAVLCIHGIQSHAGWYDASCRHLASSGFDVFFVDRRGSGMNTENRGFCKGLLQLCDDVERSAAHVRKQSPGVPVFLVAISWGAKLAIATLRRHPELVDGLVLVTPGFAAKVGPTLRERLMIGWSFLLWPKRLIRVPLTEPTLFTDTPAWQEFLRADRQLLRIGTARLLMTSVFLDRDIRSAATTIRLPVITFLAGQDRIIDNDQVRDYVRGFRSADNQIREYPHSHHTLEFEPDPTLYFCQLSEWLTEHSTTSQLSANASG